MANYHFSVEPISRGKGRSFKKLATYISGHSLHDEYSGKTHYHPRSDVLYSKIYLPSDAPEKFIDLQNLCSEIEKAETRCDARTARHIVASLPNELYVKDLVQIVDRFVESNFLQCDFCVIAAIHEGKNDKDLSKDNPHVHLLVPTRTIGQDGFCKIKDREYNKRKYVNQWREHWAKEQNKAYERCNKPYSVSHESYAAQGKFYLEPTIHLSRIDWQKELEDEHTEAGDKKRAIKERNEQRRKLAFERELEIMRKIRRAKEKERDKDKDNERNMEKEIDKER